MKLEYSPVIGFFILAWTALTLGQGTTELYEIEFLMEPAQAWAINDQSESVGYTQGFEDFQKVPRFFADGKNVVLNAPNPIDINDSGQILGFGGNYLLTPVIPSIPGDLNEDGLVTLLDVQPFVTRLQAEIIYAKRIPMVMERSICAMLRPLSHC